ncbi:MAG: hypothetical protein IJX44_04550 [Bacteroidaceae bacterium]|nr:hypothetical protein [Bacteroidaceae bacterium]
MEVDIKSQEFANAWRIVSEALLSYLQSGEVKPTVLMNNLSGQQAGVKPVVSHIEAVPNKTSSVVDVRYAACPVKQTDGTYNFRNLKEERQQESTYKITRYADGSCEFELCDLQGEARQIFKDNQSDRMPSYVGTSTGEITADNKIVNVKPGRGIVDGRSVKITESLVVEFK